MTGQLLPDIPRWAGVVAALLAPGGFLYLVEAHPFAQILDDAAGTTDGQYRFPAGRPRVPLMFSLRATRTA